MTRLETIKRWIKNGSQNQDNHEMSKEEPNQRTVAITNQLSFSIQLIITSHHVHIKSCKPLIITIHVHSINHIQLIVNLRRVCLFVEPLFFRSV